MAARSSPSNSSDGENGDVVDRDGVADLVDRLRAGERRALGRAITRVENRGPGAEELVRRLHPHVGDAWIVGITGATGSGKSTLVDHLARIYRERDERVGIVAVDPTSPFTGGALLGDRLRMQRHGTDPDVFVRSMATRGALGGLAVATYDAVELMAAAGYRRLLVETIGAGQEEVDVVGLAHTTCVVVTPAGGDEIQAIKAGIMEIADVLILNKADLPGANRAASQLRASLEREGEDGGWSIPIVRVIATEGTGTEELVEALDEHEGWARETGRAREKRRTNAAARLRQVLTGRMMQRVRRELLDPETEERLVEAIVAGETDPYTAADRVLEGLRGVGEGSDGG